MAESLFGMTPQDIQAQRQAAMRQQAQQFAQMPPEQRAAMALYQGGNQLGGALAGMMGAKDPELEKANMVNSLVKETDMTDLDSVKGLAQKLTKAGATREAMALLPRIDALTKQTEDRTARSEDKQAAIEAKKEEIRLRGEQRLVEIRLKAEADLQRARERAATDKELNQIRVDAQREMANARLQMSQLIASMKTNADRNRPQTAAEIRAEEKKQARAEATDSLDSTLTDMETLVGDLEKSGGMSSTARSPFKNLLTSVETSGVGQAAGRVVGSKDQTNRDVLAAQKLRLLNDIKQATGMSAQEMNSNVELKLQLDSLGAPGMTAEANKAILAGIRAKFINKSKPPATPKEPSQPKTKKGTSYQIIED